MSSFRKYTFLKITIGLIVILVIGQIIGSLTIRYLFINQQIQTLFPQLEEIAKDISETGEVHHHAGSFIIKIYDKNATLMSEQSTNQDLDMINKQLNLDLSPYVLKVLAGSNISKVTNLRALSQSSIVLGTPIIQGEQIIGAVFLLKPATDYNAALMSFYFVFFGVTMLSGGVIVFILRLYLLNHDKLEITRRNYIANVSHELRSPIAAIKALSETLCDDIVDDQQTKYRYYHIIRRESFRLERLIQDMLELSHLQSGNVALKKERFQGSKLVNEIAEKYTVLAMDMGINLTFEESIK